jgi:hypothetical protein
MFRDYAHERRSLGCFVFLPQFYWQFSWYRNSLRRSSLLHTGRLQLP